jgi:hypothetical protein
VRKTTFASRGSTEELYKQNYHIGIIDFLQDWSFQKKFEKSFKSLWLKKGDSKGLSAVPPI